ncbi:MAG TPA: glycosyltransferase [Gaiellaceae bacterium]|jgi:GT2 family glycosyltransferase|nr:glycosyltransferase [Gaiellaceae bacterium]
MIRLDDLVTHGSGVLVPAQEGTAATYLDGAEQYLLDALRSSADVGVFSSDLRARVRDWASLYHLTPYRATILDALGLSNRDASVLELGAGCGAVTRWLGEHFGRVDAVEGSLARAQVARERCRDLESVRVAAANFFDLDFGRAYDIATLIGVLEYSHLYHPEHRDDPAAAALSNLELARRSLAADGMLVIAIENKLGLKYLGGSHEDHASRRYEGIEGYPSRRSAVTYSAAELERLVLAAGFSAVDFYLPFPDYKLARTVFDASLADASTYPANWVETPFADRAGPQAHSPFNESLALREVVAGGLLRDLSNSFLVLAHNGDRETVRERLGVEDGWVARHYSLDRHPGFAKRTSLEREDGELVVRNTAAAPAEPPSATALTQRLEDEAFRPGHQLLFTIHEHAAAGRLEHELPALLAELHGFLVTEYGTGRTDGAGLALLDGAAIDATPWNIVVEPGTGAWASIDREWRYDGPLPVDYILWRGLHHPAARHHALGGSNSARFALDAVRALLPAVTPDRLGLYEEFESFIQHAAGAEPGAAVITPRMRALGDPPKKTEPAPVVAAFAEELIESPELLAEFTRGLGGEYVTLVAYAPDADPAAIAPRLEPLIDGLDVVLLALPRDPADEQRLAEAASALLSARDADGPLAGLPRASASETLRDLVLADPGPPPLVSIVIPVFNRDELTRQCLEAIRETAAETASEVIVIDNASTDGTAAFLRAEQTGGRVRCVINAGNQGFGGACNQGASLARGEFVLLLNNDTIPQPGWLESLVETMADRSIGIAGSRLLYPDGTIQHAGIVWNKEGKLDHVHRGAAADDPAVLIPRDFAAVTGACLIIRRETFFELGAFDRSYHMYVEDVDLCIRTWDAGLRVAYCPASVVIHLENASVTDLAWRDENVVAGWQRLDERWAGRWPDPVRRFAWPHALAGSPRHLAALCFADDLAAHPELLEGWCRVFRPEEARLVVYGAGIDPAALAATVERLAREGGLEADVFAVAAPAGLAPPPEIIRTIVAVLSSTPPEGELADLAHADASSVESLRPAASAVALVA